MHTKSVGVGLEEFTALWTVRELSTYLRVPVGTIYQWRHRGEGPPAMRLGNHLRFEPRAVQRWAQDQVR